MRLRSLAAGAAAFGLLLAPASAAMAADETIEDVRTWVSDNAEALKYDPEACTGLGEMTTFAEADAIAKAHEVNLAGRLTSDNPLADRHTAMVAEFCAYEAPVEATDDPTDEATESPEPTGEASDEPADATESPAATDETTDDDPTGEASESPEPAATPSKGADEPEPVEACEPDQDLLELVDALPVADEKNSGYDRDRFAYDSRDAVLTQEKRDDGTWLSLWDATVHESADTLEVDHTVPLKEAWGSGAHAWTDEELKGYANDVDNPFVMNAITSELNSAKGDRDPFDWMPNSNVGEYVKQWATVKTRYGLTVDGEEKMRLHAAAAEVCGDDISVPTVPDAQEDLGEAQDEVGMPGGSMAETGASGPPPWLMIGSALTAIGSGAALILLRRKGIL